MKDSHISQENAAKGFSPLSVSANGMLHILTNLNAILFPFWGASLFTMALTILFLC